MISREKVLLAHIAQLEAHLDSQELDMEELRQLCNHVQTLSQHRIGHVPSPLGITATGQSLESGVETEKKGLPSRVNMKLQLQAERIARLENSKLSLESELLKFR